MQCSITSIFKCFVCWYELVFIIAADCVLHFLQFVT